ncbi:MAG: GNAT family N-acetyltransferase [Oscillospiraceae bacterium]|jgi:predicted acetyltransferase|nr:GNAT family N-acetyltransferase [Oscillospiraceae bacterium]
MTVRPLIPEELALHCQLSSMAFHWNCKLEEETFPENEIPLACFDDNGGALAELEYAVRPATLGAEALPMLCVGGVASLPHARRKGAVRRLFQELEIMAADQGWALGALYPFSTAYYRQFGYEMAVHALRFTIPLRELSRLPKAPEGNFELYEGQSALTEDLLALFRPFAARHNLMMHRTDGKRFFGKPLETCQYTYLYRDAAGRPAGYVSYDLNREQHTVFVHELVWTDAASLAALLRFLQCYDSKAEQLCLQNLTPESPVTLLLNEFSASRGDLAFTASLRIYDFAAVLRARCAQSEASGQLALRIEGDSMTQNNGLYVAEFAPGAADISRPAETALPEISLTREAAARLLLSGRPMTAETLTFCPGCRLPQTGADAAVQAFLRAFPPVPTMLWDGF